MKISQKIQDVLHESWHQTDSTTPFLKTLQTLIEEHKLSTLDMSFIQNWVQKRLMADIAEQIHRLVH